MCIPDIDDKQQDTASSLRKPKVKKKRSDDITAAVQPDPAEFQGRASNDTFKPHAHCPLPLYLINSLILVLNIFIQMPQLEVSVICWRTFV